MNRFVIELLALEKGKAYGYHEYIFNLLNYFYQHREDIRYNQIIIWCKDTEISLFKEYDDKFEILGFSFSSYIKRFGLQTWLPLKYKLNSSDLLFSPGNTSGLIKRSKSLLTIHDLLFKRKKWLPNKFMRWQREICMPVSIHMADKIVAISKFTKDDIEHYYPFAKGKVEVIYNSMDFAKYQHPNKIEIVGDFFLAVCSNDYHKNVKTILIAFRDYCERGGTLNLVFVGNVNKSAEVEALLKSFPKEVRKRIISMSNISNEILGGLYERASCYLSASLFEGLGMPVVEAMSFGIPVILSDIAPHREVSINKGVYFAPTDSEELCSKMFDYKKGKLDYDKDIRFLFSEGNTSAKYVELINELSQGNTELTD